MMESFQKIKDFYIHNKDSWYLLLANTMESIQAFKNTEMAKKEKFLYQHVAKYPLDIQCEMAFILITVGLENMINFDEYSFHVKHTSNIIPKNLIIARDLLKLFLAKDHNPVRQEKYLAALKFLDKLGVDVGYLP